MEKNEIELIVESVYGDDEELPAFFEIEKDVANTLLEAVSINRWTKSKESLYCVMSVKEAHQACLNVIKELDKAGYKIIKK